MVLLDLPFLFHFSEPPEVKRTGFYEDIARSREQHKNGSGIQVPHRSRRTHNPHHPGGIVEALVRIRREGPTFFDDHNLLHVCPTQRAAPRDDTRVNRAAIT